MIWFRVCAGHGPECEKHGPNPDFQWMDEYGTGLSPKIEPHMVTDDKTRVKNVGDHAMVLANIWMEDGEFYAMWREYPRLIERLEKVRELARHLATL
jgi:hypothetical protein